MKYSVSMFHISFQCFISKNTVGAIQKHNGSDTKTQWERYKNTEGAITRTLSVLKNET